MTFVLGSFVGIVPLLATLDGCTSVVDDAAVGDLGSFKAVVNKEYMYIYINWAKS